MKEKTNNNNIKSFKMKLINKTKSKKEINYITFDIQNVSAEEKENYKNIYICKTKYD